MPNVDVSMVSGTFNRIKLLQRMVETARNSVGNLKYEFVIVDGGSMDGTKEWAKRQEDIRLIEHPGLLGAIKAYNDGCFASRGEYVQILNDDIEVEGDSIVRAFRYLEQYPQVGQVAFGHRYQRRGERAKKEPRVAKHYGYTYGQCCMTRKWLGDLAGWWGNDGMVKYGGDSRLSMRLWEMGWPVIGVRGCAVTDYEHEDNLRRIGDSEMRAQRSDGAHPDTVQFGKVWKGRLPKPADWIPAPHEAIHKKAAAGILRVLRFKGQFNVSHKLRTAMISEFGKLGVTKMLGQTSMLRNHGGKVGFQAAVKRHVEEFRPDIVFFQAQREGFVEPSTCHWIKQHYPHIYLINWDGDVHPNLLKFHFDIAKSVDLQLTISPDLFPAYIKNGAHNIGYWPISVEHEFLDQKRNPPNQQDIDVLFLGSLFGEGSFPEAMNRRHAVVAMVKSGLKFDYRGGGYDKIGMPNKPSWEDFSGNPKLYARSKMAISISQTSDLWGYTSDRLYNICATGCPALAKRFKGMEEHGYVDGKTCIVWRNNEEMVEKARYYLSHEKEREAIGRAGREITSTRHTWDRRVEELMAMIGGL